MRRKLEEDGGAPKKRRRVLHSALF